MFAVVPAVPQYMLQRMKVISIPVASKPIFMCFEHLWQLQSQHEGFLPTSQWTHQGNTLDNKAANDLRCRVMYGVLQDFFALTHRDVHIYQKRLLAGAFWKSVYSPTHPQITWASADSKRTWGLLAKELVEEEDL
jgi:hypothetical protein